MKPALHKPAYNRAKTARVGAFAQLSGGGKCKIENVKCKICSYDTGSHFTLYTLHFTLSKATCRAPCATCRLACFCL